MININSTPDTVDNQEDQTEFNAAIATLMRIDKIKQKLTRDRFEEDYLSHYRGLSSFFMELISVLNDKEEAEELPNFMKHKKNYRELKILMGKSKNSVPLRLIDWLDEWERVLKNLEQKHGMNLPKKGDPRYALAGRR